MKPTKSPPSGGIPLLLLLVVEGVDEERTRKQRFHSLFQPGDVKTLFIH
jgi:hypothetical protein